MKSNLYTEQFFHDRVDGAIESARKTVPYLIDWTRCRSVIDVGCGTGVWLSVFREQHIEDILGIDGNYVNRASLVIPPDKFVAADLTSPPRIDRTFDLAICLEVAEHLPSAGNDALIDYLTRLSPVVVFSGSIPFQDGIGHINEQWLEYWVELFRRRNYVAVDAVRHRVWNEPTVDWWYAQNIIVYVLADALPRYPKLAEITHASLQEPHSHVHPNLLKHKERRLTNRRVRDVWRETFSLTWAAMRRRIKGENL